MQIKNKINRKKYLIGTSLNIILISQVFTNPNILVGLVFLMCVIVNQFLLAIVVSDLTGVDKNYSIMPTWLAGILKLLVLLCGFYYAMSSTVEKELFLVLIYIFQLIILVLSIKRVVEKN